MDWFFVVPPVPEETGAALKLGSGRGKLNPDPQQELGRVTLSLPDGTQHDPTEGPRQQGGHICRWGP